MFINKSLTVKIKIILCYNVTTNIIVRRVDKLMKNKPLTPDSLLKFKKFFYKDSLVSTFKAITDSSNQKIYYEYVPSKLEIELIKAIATEKSKHTNSHSQDDKIRSDDEKKNKQFEGCLAELAVAKFLVHILGESPQNVEVYDAVRPNFEYVSKEEYDIKVSKNGITKKCEVRNSWSYKTNIFEFCSNSDVIGKYTNSTKHSEELADFFIRPVLQLNTINLNLKQPPKNAIELIETGEAKLYIVAACTQEEMKTLGKENKQMTRNSTKFFCTKINRLDSISNFKIKYDKLFN